MNTITHMITKYESKYGCRYMYTSYHTDINLHVDTKIWAKSTCSNLKSHSWTWLARPFSGAFWSWWNFPPLIFFRTHLSSLNLALPCGLPASPAVALPGYWKASHPSPRYTQGFCWCHFQLSGKNCLNQNSDMKQPHATLKQTQKHCCIQVSFLGGQSSIANSCQTMETTWNDLPQSPQSPQCFIAIHLLAPKFHQRKQKMKSEKRLLKQKTSFQGVALHSGVPWSICFGPPSVVALRLQHCAAQTELHVGQRGTTWDEERCKEICLEKVLFWGLLQRIGEEYYWQGWPSCDWKMMLETARNSCASPAATLHNRDSQRLGASWVG